MVTFSKAFGRTWEVMGTFTTHTTNLHLFFLPALCVNFLCTVPSVQTVLHILAIYAYPHVIHIQYIILSCMKKTFGIVKKAHLCP